VSTVKEQGLGFRHDPDRISVRYIT